MSFIIRSGWKSQQILDFNRQLPHAHTRRVVGRCGDRSRDSGEADLADAARTYGVELKVRIIEEMHFELWHVGVYCHHVVGQVAVDRRAVLRVIMRFFQHRHAYAHHDGAFDLVATCEWIDNAAAVDYRDNAIHAQPRDLRLPGDFDKVTSE